MIFFVRGLKFDHRYGPKRSKKSNSNIPIVFKRSEYDLGFAPTKFRWLHLHIDAL